MVNHRKVLPNGLRLITVPMPSLESVTAMVMVGAGSRYETKKNNGISHFLEHMAFKGTQKRPTAMDISMLIDGIGGEFNAFTGKETTGYYVKAGAAHLDVLLDVLSDMLMNSKLDAAEIEKEKGVILEEINLYEDTPARKIGDVYERLLYGDTPMGWDIAGEKDVIRSITRNDFISYMNSLYSASNITLVIAGGITEKDSLLFAEKYFGEMPGRDTQSYIKVEETQRRPEVLIKKKETEQVHVALGFRTVPLSHPDRYPLTLLAAILGGGMSSRLFNEVREKRGLAYYVRSGLDQYKDVGNIVSTAGVDAKRIDEAITVMLSEHRKIQSTKSEIRKEELAKAKEFIKGHLVLELEDSRSVSAFYASQELLEKEVKNPDEVMADIDKVTLKEVSAVAGKYLKEKNLNLAVIGNFGDPTRFQKLLE